MSHMLIETESFGNIEIELYDDIAPEAIGRMKEVAEMGLYNNMSIERLEPGFAIQPLFYDGRNSEIDVMVEPEFRTVEANRGIPFERYTVGMAGDENRTSGSQFFICLGRYERLDGNFTIVGKVVSGFDAIALIEDQPVDEHVDAASGRTFHTPKNNLEIREIHIHT